VDVIITGTTPAALLARDRAPSMPVVLAIAGDPVALGLVASLAHPGGNVTGVSGGGTALSTKKVEVVKALLPGLSRLAIFAQADNPSATQQTTEMRAAAACLDCSCCR
jgi:putative ABC transport system substrate-binding protein